MKKLITTFVALLICLFAGAQDAKQLYEEGKALFDAKNYTAAIAKLKPAAEKGNKKAQYRMGRCYDKGNGVKEDNKTAFMWYSKSADQGYAKAQFQLAKCYMKGKGVAADQAKAKTLLLKAVRDEKHGKEIMDKLKKDAAAGNVDAQNMLKLVKKR